MTDDRGAQPIRLGISGTGLAVEHRHWPALRRLTDRCRVVAFCDTERGHAERFAGYSGAVGNDTASSPELAVPPETNELRRYGDQAVMTLQRYEIRVHCPDGTIETHLGAGSDGGYAAGSDSSAG